MSPSTSPDDYAGLVNPWKSVAEAALKIAPSLHDSTETDHGNKVSISACINSNQDHDQANVV